MYFLKILVPAIVAVFILRGFFLIPVRVDGHSMQKTLNQGDMIVMEKFSAIKRFDVVVFKTDTGSILIKRVIVYQEKLCVTKTISYMSIISQSLNRI